MPCSTRAVLSANAARSPHLSASRPRRWWKSAASGARIATSARRTREMPLLEVTHVRKTFRRSRTLITAVDDVSFEVDVGETLGIIGESGSGKSTLGRIAVGLIQPDNGVVRFDTINFSTLSAREIRATRSQIQVVFQEPQE